MLCHQKNFVEKYRISFTRFTLFSTNLECEKSRWLNDDTNTPTCECSSTQTEEHVFFQCPLRKKRHFNNFYELFDAEYKKSVMRIIYDTLIEFES